MIDIDQILKLTSNHSVWLPFLMGIYIIGKGRLTSNGKPIVLLITISLISDVISIYLAKTYGNNMPWFHTYQLLEGTILVIYFYTIFGRKKEWLIIGIGFIAFLLINSVFIGSLFTFNTRGTSASSIFFIIQCLIYYYFIFSSEKTLFIERSGHFWIVTGILIYYSGSFFTFLTYETFKTWMFHNMANTLKNMLFLIGLFLQFKYEQPTAKQ